MEKQEAVLPQVNPQSRTVNGTAPGTRRESDTGPIMVAGASMWSKMIPNLPFLAYLKTMILALGFICFLYVISPSLEFWSGVAFILAVQGIALYKILGIRGVQADPSSLADSQSRAEDMFQTIQTSCFQDVSELNQIIAGLWSCTAKGCEVRIEKIMQQMLDNIITGASQQIKLGPITGVTFGRFLDKVIADAQQKIQDTAQSFILRSTHINSKVHLGTKPPEISEFRYPGGVDECVFETQVRWEPEYAQLEFSIEFLKRPTVTVQVKNVTLQGTVKLVLKPLRNDFPGFGAVMVSVLEAPLVDFDLDLGGNWLGNLLDMKKKIKESIESLFIENLVCPRSMVLIAFRGQDSSSLQSQAIGLLKVKLNKAESMAHTHGYDAVFLKAYVSENEPEYSSDKKPHSHVAVWDETYTLEVKDPEKQKLTLQLSRRSRLSCSVQEKLIGSCKLGIAQFQPGETKEMSCDLEDPQNANTTSGKVFLAITYHRLSVGAGPGLDNVQRC